LGKIAIGPEDEMLAAAPQPCSDSWYLPSDKFNSWRGGQAEDRRIGEEVEKVDSGNRERHPPA
jgi:hypothetical protein